MKLLRDLLARLKRPPTAKPQTRPPADDPSSADQYSARKRAAERWKLQHLPFIF